MTLHYMQQGDGPDLVLLHGWGLHGGIWAPLADALASRFRLHMIDLPGHGHSALIDPYDLDTLCTVLAEQLPVRAFWLGWSLGGLIALAFAARFPERVTRLALLASNPRFVAQDTQHPGMRPEVLENFATELLTDHAATLRRFLSLVARGAPDQQVLRELRRRMDELPAPQPAALRAGLQLLRDTDATATLGALHTPTCLIGGVRDSLVPIAALRQLQARFPRLALYEIEAAGHAPFLSHPHPTAALLKEFFV